MIYKATKRETGRTYHNTITKRMYDVAAEICEKYKEQQIKLVKELNGINTYPIFDKNTRIKDCHEFLSIRAINCLIAASIDTFGDLEKYHIADLLKFNNMGKKSLAEIEKLAALININLYK
jgi:DNA-directed RNA polymerase alpha subunit